jgi:hypothetical protein
MNPEFFLYRPPNPEKARQNPLTDNMVANQQIEREGIVS